VLRSPVQDPGYAVDHETPGFLLAGDETAIPAISTAARTSTDTPHT
jgi:NADPH-dependent ferric siderophore reductase